MKFYNLFICVMLLGCIATAQTAVLTGFVVDSTGGGVERATVKVLDKSLGTKTDSTGFFRLQLNTNESYIIEVSQFGFYPKKINIFLIDSTTKKINIVLASNAKIIKTVNVIADKNRSQAGNVYLNPSQMEYMPTALNGIEALIKTFVGTNNELTSNYNVRGGNFDENLVYINDFEVYRPFLARSGQQEGLSIINPDLVQNASFSTGGFQAKFGDKMSSVLDIDYKQPKRNQGSISMSLLGIGAHFEGIAKNGRIKYLLGFRQKSNQYLLQSLPNQGVYRPSYSDFQGLINYDINAKWELEVFINSAKNIYNYTPTTSFAKFGTWDFSLGLQVYYDGAEKDKFNSQMGGYAIAYKPNEKNILKLLISNFQTNEQELIDIIGQYRLGILQSDPTKDNYGNIQVSLGDAVIQNYSRNYLKVSTTNYKFIGKSDLKNHYLQYGININQTYVADKLMEWEARDSAGFLQPVNPTTPVLSKIINSYNSLSYKVFSVFFQDNMILPNKNLTLNYGIRGGYQTNNKEFLISPRFQFSYKLPSNDSNRNVLLKLSSGLYQQPNFYREMRDMIGHVNPKIKSQKSAHFVLGADYNFKLFNRPFKFTSEVYYKYMWDLISFEYDNVRIRYFGSNNSKGYAYGWENRLYGQFVNGVDSWFSLGIMKTQEDILNDSYVNSDNEIVYPGYLPRPTDSRVNFGMFFQDYLKTNKNFKVHVNFNYSKGLPTGFVDGKRYNDNYRLPSYYKIDIGFSALLLDKERSTRPYYSMFNKLESIWLSAEILNLVGRKNTISYSWHQDYVTNYMFAVPNYLTGRLFNLKLITKF